MVVMGVVRVLNYALLRGMGMQANCQGRGQRCVGLALRWM